jgi:hypothetical protein
MLAVIAEITLVDTSWAVILRAKPEGSPEVLRGVQPEPPNEILRGVYPEPPVEILRYAQGDRR